MFDPVWILRQSWFAVSPSPFSFAFYIIAGVAGAWRLLRSDRRLEDKRFSWVIAFAESLCLLVLLVLIQDTIWLSFNTFRWILPLYSGVANFWNYYVRFAQNGIGLLLMTLLSFDRFRAGWFRFTSKAMFYLMVIVFIMGLTFAAAPNQASSDWIFAATHGYPDWLVLQGFLLNVVVKILLFLCFINIVPETTNRRIIHKSFKRRDSE